MTDAEILDLPSWVLKLRELMEEAREARQNGA